jgi:hypothetical protein
MRLGKNRIEYGFVVGERFIVEIHPQEKNKMIFSVESFEGDLPIQIGFFEKTSGSIIQDIGLESVLDVIPDGKFRILLEKMEVSE